MKTIQFIATAALCSTAVQMIPSTMATYRFRSNNAYNTPTHPYGQDDTNIPKNDDLGEDYTTLYEADDYGITESFPTPASTSTISNTDVVVPTGEEEEEGGNDYGFDFEDVEEDGIYEDDQDYGDVLEEDDDLFEDGMTSTTTDCSDGMDLLEEEELNNDFGGDDVHHEEEEEEDCDEELLVDEDGNLIIENPIVDEEDHLDEDCTDLNDQWMHDQDDDEEYIGDYEHDAVFANGAEADEKVNAASAGTVNAITLVSMLVSTLAGGLILMA